MSVTINGTNGLTFNDASTQNTSPFAGGLGFRNRIINGAMMIDQRNAGASVTPTTTGYTVDRWQLYITQASKASIQQVAVSTSGFSKALKITSLSAYSITSTDRFQLTQPIEGFNIADLGWGTASAKAVTLSFVVNSSLTGTFGGCVNNGSTNRSYVFSYSIPVANADTTISVTIPGDTTGTWATDSTQGLFLSFGLGVGSTYSTTAGAWKSGTYLSATGATSVVGTNGATFYITGIQLEKGSTATSFDYRPYGTELALCQRYYWKSLVLVSATANTISYTIPVPMRATPTINTLPSSGSGAAFTVLAIAGNQSIYQSSVNSGATSAIIDTSGAEL